MSKNVNDQIPKINPKAILNNLLSSYNTLKLILSPNLSENNIHFMNSIIDVIISQIKIFLELLNLTEPQKIFELLNINSQNLSKQIAALYEVPKISSKYFKDSLLLEKDKIENNTQLYINNKKDNDSLEEQKQIINIIDSTNFDFIENQNKDKKENSKDFIKINKNEKINIKINKDKNKSKEKEKEKERERLLKKEKEEKDKLKEKEMLIQSLKEQEKERGREIREKARELIKKQNYYKENSKIQLKKNSNFAKHKPRNKAKVIKFGNISNLKEFEPKVQKLKIKKEVKPENRYKSVINCINRTPIRNRFKFFLFDDDDIDEVNLKEENFIKRKEKKSKTLFDKDFRLPYEINIEELENNDNNKTQSHINNNNYISFNFTNRLLDRVKKKPKSIKNKFLIKTENERENSEKIKNKILNYNNRYNYNNYVLKTEPNKKYKKRNFYNINNIQKTNLNNDFFSLDEFVVPYNNSKKGEELFVTKIGNVLMSKKQKDILEDYINNYLYENEENSKLRKSTSPKSNKKLNNIIPLTKEVKEKIKKEKRNRKFKTKKSMLNYDLNDINELIQSLRTSLKVPIDDLYLRQKKASLFDRSIFKICHRLIDNYKELENKEDIFTLKTRSKSRPMLRAKSYNDNLVARSGLNFKRVKSKTSLNRVNEIN